MSHRACLAQLQERLRNLNRQTASSLVSSHGFALRETRIAREAAKLQLPAALSLNNDQNTTDVFTKLLQHCHRFPRVKLRNCSSLPLSPSTMTKIPLTFSQNYSNIAIDFLSSLPALPPRE
jgi:hypothetical protein